MRMFSPWLKPMIAWTAVPARVALGWRCAIAILAGALTVASIGNSLLAAQKPKAALFQDKTASLLKRGYVELSGDDAARFLVGNSVVIKRTDTPRGIPAYDYDVRYYFSDSNTAYECTANDCSKKFWKIDGRDICFEFPERCEDPTYKFYTAPRIFKAPQSEERAGRIGVYLTYTSIIHAVVRGNATIAPLLEPGGVGTMIEVNSSDFSREIEASSKFSGGDKEVPVVGARAVSFLIGNTFISGETVVDEKGIHFCPEQGYYYSPDGRIITFNCFHWPDFWEMGVTHWKLASGRLCIEDVENLGKFGCGDRFEKVQLIPSDQHDEWRVLAEVFPRKIFGYTGNIFQFK